MTAIVSKAFTATGTSTEHFIPAGKFNATVAVDSFTGSVQIERSFDDGATWNVLSRDADGTPNAFTAAADLVLDEPEGARYRWNCTARSAGTATCRFGRR